MEEVLNNNVLIIVRETSIGRTTRKFYIAVICIWKNYFVKMMLGSVDKSNACQNDANFDVCVFSRILKP